MEKLDLITRPKIYDKGYEVVSMFYLVPSMVKKNAPDTLHSNAVEVFFKFNDILPPAVFNRLVCSCLSLWTVHNGVLCHGYVELESGLNHLLVIRREFKTIAVSISNKKYPDDIDMNLCRSVKQYICQSIQRIVSLYDSAFSDGNDDLYSLEYNEHAIAKRFHEVNINNLFLVFIMLSF